MSQLAPCSSLGLQVSTVSLFLQLSVHLAYPGGLFSRNRSHLGGGLVCSPVWERSQITHSDLPSRLCGWFPLLWGSQHPICPWGKGESSPE